MSDSTRLSQIDAILEDIEQLAQALRTDPDGHVCRSAAELRRAFASRTAIEPAVARVMQSVRMVRRASLDGSRREFQRQVRGLNRIERTIGRDLIPQLRSIGFEV